MKGGSRAPSRVKPKFKTDLVLAYPTQDICCMYI